MIRITYVDNNNQTQTIDLDDTYMDMDILNQYFINNLGYYPKNVIGEMIEE